MTEWTYIDLTPVVELPENPVDFHPVHPALGILPSFVSLDDERDAVTQLDESYAHGGGWIDFEGFAVATNESGQYLLQYPGDPEYREVSRGALRDELIVVFDYGWVMVIDPSDMTKHRIARLD